MLSISQSFISAFREAFHSLKAKPLHTVLSLLGIIIGVGALVSILALGDGMEKFGRDQIAATTDVNSIQISPVTTTMVDGIRMDKKSIPTLTKSDVDSLNKLLQNKAIVKWMSTSRGWAKLENDTIQKPTLLYAVSANIFESSDSILAGKIFTENDLIDSNKHVVINPLLAARLSQDSLRINELVGKRIIVNTEVFTIKGILKSNRDKSQQSILLLPFTAIAPQQKANYNTQLVVSVIKTEDVPTIKSKVEHFFSNGRYQKDDFRISSNEFRVNQLRKGILLFKTIMGLIVGISILVGGIGIMNVLLMSVTERTREIGIRKAIGAKPKEIALQFMAEAMTISIVGSIMGILFGMLTLSIAMPIVKRVLQGDVLTISYRPQSLMIILIIAVIIGLVFGTYPAYKASKQSPIDAIRVE